TTSCASCSVKLGRMVMSMRTPLLAVLSLVAMLASTQVDAADSSTLDAGTLGEIDALYRRLIKAENHHDLAAGRALLWDSPSTLLVAKTATGAEDNWAGFWGTEVVMRHFHDLYQGTFVMAPDYARVKTVGLTANVAETYAPLDITVAYAG